MHLDIPGEILDHVFHHARLPTTQHRIDEHEPADAHGYRETQHPVAPPVTPEISPAELNQQRELHDSGLNASVGSIRSTFSAGKNAASWVARNITTEATITGAHVNVGCMRLGI